MDRNNFDDNEQKIKTDLTSLDDEITTNEKIEQIEKAIIDKNIQLEFKEALEDYESFLDSRGTDDFNNAEKNNAEQLGEQIEKLSEDIEKHMKLLETMFETKITADGQREKLIDSMHAELEQYKNDMFAKIFKPLLTDVIYLREDMRKVMRTMKEKDGQISADKFFSILDGYIMDTADILEKYDVEIFNCEEDEYVPIRQKIIKVLPTDDEKLSGIVADKLSDGYMLNEKVIFPQKAVVYKFNKIDGGEN